MVTSISKSNKIYGILAFALGLSVSEGIASILTVGNTSFTLSEVLSPLLFIYLVFKRKNQINNFANNIPLGFKLFFVLVIISIIPGMFYFQKIEVLRRYLFGLGYFLIILTTAADVFILRDYKENIWKGLFFGFCVNIFFTLLCFLLFKSGYTLTLSDLVSRSNFFVPIYSFRSQGFFLEPSHFTRYISSILLIPIATYHVNNSFVKYLLIICSAVAIVLSFSGSIVILMVGLFLYYLLSSTNNKANMMIIILLLPVFLLLVFVLLLFYSEDLLKEIFIAIYRVFQGANIRDASNAFRFNSMITFSKYIKDGFLLGYGWNLIGSLAQYKNLGSTAAFSEFLELILETGILGGVLYMFSLIAFVFKLLKKRSKYSSALAVSLLIIFALQVGTDYAMNSCIMLVFGLSLGELEERRNLV